MKLLLIVLFACVCLSQARFKRTQDQIVNTRNNPKPKIQSRGKVFYYKKWYWWKIYKNLSIDNSKGSPILKIVGGNITDISKVPYQLSVVRSAGNHNCGASIISKIFALRYIKKASKFYRISELVHNFM